LHFLNGPLGREQAKLAATGSAHPHINLGDIRKYIIAVPPREEQETIVKEIERRLSVIDEFDAIADGSLKRAEVLRRSVLSRAFSGRLIAHRESRAKSA
jgi:type I restriction enzyme S subunit